jgi:hypothetical protein
VNPVDELLRESMMHREPTPIEVAVLMCAHAIDVLGRELKHFSARLDEIDKRDSWVDSYRADDSPPAAYKHLLDLDESHETLDP